MWREGEGLAEKEKKKKRLHKLSSFCLGTQFKSGP